MFLTVVVTCLCLFVFLCLYLTGYVDRVVRWQKSQHDRISKLEVHERDQDNMLMSHDSRLDRQHGQLQMIRKDVRELGKDVGWGDDMTKTQLAKTQVMFPKEPDESSDE